MTIDLINVWRDKILADEIRSEIKRQAVKGWKPWQVNLPPDLLWPMLTEVSQGMFQQWSPTLLGVGVQVGEQHEVSIQFVLKDMKTSPIMTKAMPYHNLRTTVPVEVSHGNTL